MRSKCLKIIIIICFALAINIYFFREYYHDEMSENIQKKDSLSVFKLQNEKGIKKIDERIEEVEKLRAVYAGDYDSLKNKNNLNESEYINMHRVNSYDSIKELVRTRKYNPFIRRQTYDTGNASNGTSKNNLTK